MEPPASEGAQQGRAVLVALYNAAGGASWTDRTNWLSDAPIGDWYGVTTDTDGRVMDLSLAGNNLTGSLPTELGHLSNLQVLELAGNSLDGALPAAWNHLRRLDVLDLSRNSLSGVLPAEWGQLDSLGVLNLSDNGLVGPLPAEWGQLSDLEVLLLFGNSLSGVLPVEWGELASIRVLKPLRQQPPGRAAGAVGPPG